MSQNPVTRKPVLFQLSTGLYIGLVCFNPVYETLKFVLEKREFFEVEWPALVTTHQQGLTPILIGIPYFTVQRTQLLWYTLQIPDSLLTQYHSYVPHLFQHFPMSVPSDPSSKVIKKKDQGEKIIKFPFKKQRDEKDGG